jgi:DNA-binding response OmpR family regulator
LVILDLSIPMDGVETASALRRMVPGTKIIGLAMFAGEFRRTLIAAAGFDMILSKHEGLAKLAEAINALLAAEDSGIHGYFGSAGVSSVRILVVEDFVPFRRLICWTLGRRRDLQVIGEAFARS